MDLRQSGKDVGRDEGLFQPGSPSSLFANQVVRPPAAVCANPVAGSVLSGPGAAGTSGAPPGAKIVWEWRGVLHVAEVHEGGFECPGRLYRPLSAIAIGSPGANWSGPGFLGQRKSAAMSVPPVRSVRCVVYTRNSSDEGPEQRTVGNNHGRRCEVIGRRSEHAGPWGASIARPASREQPRRELAPSDPATRVQDAGVKSRPSAQRFLTRMSSGPERPSATWRGRRARRGWRGGSLARLQ